MKAIDYNIPSELSFCKKLYNWISVSDIKTHPLASLTALLTIASAVTARTYYTHTKASTTLFTVLIAKTGSGKNTVVKIPSSVMGQIDQEMKIISSKISSEGAMDDIFKQQTVAVHVIDEFGDQLAHMIGDTGGYLKVVAAKMKSLYSLTNGVYHSGRYSSAGGKQKKAKAWSLKRPCNGLTGLTTQAQLLSKLDENMLHDGFLNRFIMLNGQNVESQFNDFPEYDIPCELLKYLKSIKIASFHREENEKSTPFSNPKSDDIEYLSSDNMITIPLSQEAQQYYSKHIGDADLKDTDIYHYCQDDDTEIKRAISVRWRENSIRLATALTALEKLEEVPLSVLKWCYQLVKHSSINFLELFNENSTTTKYEILKNKATSWFKKHNTDDKYITLTHLAQNARPFSALKSKERRELLDDLVESGIIVKQEGESQLYFKLAS